MSNLVLNTVRYYTDSDVYHYTVDNRPLEDLASNDQLLLQAIQTLSTGSSGSSGSSGSPGQVTRTVQNITATSNGQSTFTTSGYTVGMVDVYLSGVRLVGGIDFTATDGSTVVLSSTAAGLVSVGSILVVEGFLNYTIANAVQASSLSSVTGATLIGYGSGTVESVLDSFTGAIHIASPSGAIANYLQAQAATSGNAPSWQARGSDSSVSMSFDAQGAAGAYTWTNNSFGTVLAKLSSTGAFSAFGGFRVQEGSNSKQGTATLSSGTVVVSNTSVTANSRIFLTAQDNNTIGALRISSRTPGVSFTITSSTGTDSGVVAYEIFEPAS